MGTNGRWLREQWGRGSLPTPYPPTCPSPQQCPNEALSCPLLETWCQADADPQRRGGREGGRTRPHGVVCATATHGHSTVTVVEQRAARQDQPA